MRTIDPVAGGPGLVFQRHHDDRPRGILLRPQPPEVGSFLKPPPPLGKYLYTVQHKIGSEVAWREIAE